VGRPLRIIDPELVYHVWCRGNNRGPLAWDFHDLDSLYAELSRAARRYRWAVLAWCLMPNHYHVVLRASQDDFSAGFQLINGNHSRRTNRRYGRSDHLFRHRPGSRDLKSDADLIGVLRYVGRNPLEAGLVLDAAAWHYSSYRATVGLDVAPAWLALDEVHPYFGSTPAEAAAEFARLVHDGRGLVSNTEEAHQPVIRVVDSAADRDSPIATRARAAVRRG
jgi:putative transposase